MNNNNFDAMKAVTKFGKPVTRKTVDVSNRVFRQQQLVRGK